MFLTLLACSSPVVLQDDLDPEFGLELWLREETTLHSPYVQSASFDIALVASRNRHDTSGWTFDSSDDSVLNLSEFTPLDDGLHARAFAAGEGTAELRAFGPEGELRFSESVEVLAPTEIVLVPTAEAMLEEDLFEGLPPVLVGGSATVLVTYRHEDRRLSGQASGLEVSSGEDLVATRFGEDFDGRVDLITLSPYVAGEHKLRAVLDEVAAVEVVEAVNPEQLVGLEVARTVEGGDSDSELVVAFGVDGRERLVAGVEPEWTASTLIGRGDAFYYTHDDEATESTVRVDFLGHSTEFDFQGTDPRVDTTNSPGCSATGLGASAALALAGLLIARRRS